MGYEVTDRALNIGKQIDLGEAGEKIKGLWDNFKTLTGGKIPENTLLADLQNSPLTSGNPLLWGWRWAK